MYCCAQGAFGLKIYETWSLEDTEGWSLQGGSQSFLTVVAGDLIRGLELP